MSKSNRGTSNYSFDETRIFNIDVPDMPTINPSSIKKTKTEFSHQELESMCKNPRQSAELIRYLIEIIKSL